MLQVSLPSDLGVGAGLSVSVGVVALTFYLHRLSPPLRAGWVWAAVTALVTVGIWLGFWDDRTAVRLSAYLMVVCQTVTGALLFISLVALAARKRYSVDERIATAALLYMPFFLLSAVGALLWAAGFAFVTAVLGAQERFARWQELYAESLKDIGYDLALAEVTFASLVALVAFGLLAVAADYSRRVGRSGHRGEKGAGQVARDGATYVLAAGAVMFAVVSLRYGLSALIAGTDSWLATSLGNPSVLSIYTFSVLRVVPYIPLMFGPLATVTGIVVDVLFYVARTASLPTATELRLRFRTALEHAVGQGDVVVVAHSQGSVIACDVIGQEGDDVRKKIVALVTAGSPLSSLYERFLASSLESRADQLGGPFRPPERWINFTRDGDYIGASQGARIVDEQQLRSGGHTGYWSEQDLWRHVAASISVRREQDAEDTTGEPA